MAAGLRQASKVVTHFGLAALTPWFPVHRLRGTTRASGRPATMLVAGREPWVNYLPGQFFREEPTRELIGRASVWTLPALLRRWRSEADLTLARVDRLSGYLFFRRDCLRIPEWIAGISSVPEDPAAFVRTDARRRDDLRLARRNRLVPIVSHDDADFDAFYETFYVPHVKRRFGELSYLGSRAAYRGYFRKGGILWIAREGTRVAGLLFLIAHRTFHLVAMGVIDDAELARGGLAALYIHAVEYARQQGCVQIGYGATRPALQDGVLRFKRKWGAALRDRSRFEYALHWNRPDAAVTDLLSRLTPIFRDGEGLSAVHVLDLDRLATAADAAEVRARYWIDGLQRLCVFNAAGWTGSDAMPRDVSILDALDVATLAGGGRGRTG